MSDSKKNDELVGLYLKDINKIPMLSREEEIKLAQQAQNGDKEAKNKIINANLRFVVSVAKKVSKSRFRIFGFNKRRKHWFVKCH
jgi:DNA-directed RNA polymerase sigma subunit (sigma70/sigma32)